MLVLFKKNRKSTTPKYACATVYKNNNIKIYNFCVPKKLESCEEVFSFFLRYFNAVRSRILLKP